MAYLSDQATTSMDDFFIKFDLEKYYEKPLSQITKAEKDKALKFIKNKFQQMYSNNAEEIFDIIWANQNLRGSLFGGRTESVARTYFNSLINSESSILYDFIKVE